MPNYPAIINSYLEELSQDRWVLADLIKTGGPSWAINNTKARIEKTIAAINHWADVSFAYAREA